jgi:choline dehydrogenase-like flavoprotein
VVLGCGAIETPRLLLNSASTRFPNGLANSSDLVGRYLTGHTQLNMHGYLEALVGRDPVNQDGATTTRSSRATTICARRRITSAGSSRR